MNAANTMDATVLLHDVGHAFHASHGGHDGADMLFHGLTRRLDAGHVYALIGPSGSGKSTLLSIIAGWITPLEGSVERVHCEQLHWVQQNPHGVAYRSALDHMTLPFIARGERREAANRHALALLAAFGLKSLAMRRFCDLSGGEAQRLMLARGIATAPQLLLVDEPTAQLDRHTAKEVNDHLHALGRSGVIVVIATHDPDTRDACTDVIDLRDYQ
ncbi:ABC transporter [Bifidobacterium anseris]|uniref:ABC transporter n=2 Tax=Bifidobacterium TaxID=1678 RepID=A0A2N5J2V1_9BIFI|nr:ABC transporter [Bifidobacterium anseris]